MKKGIFIVMLCLAVSALYCGVQGTAYAASGLDKHDVGGGGSACDACHVPHNAQGDKIWARAGVPTTPVYSQIGDLCYSCHDSSVTSKGLNTVFDLSKQQHKTSTGNDCNICHTVHDNTNGKFLGVAKTNNSYCETCHGVTDAGGLGDHTAGSQHPADASCNDCHQMHGAANFSVGTLTHPILVTDNTDSALCANCHNSYVSTGGGRHPAPNTTGNMNCQTCHDVHQPATTNPIILKDPNIDSAHCVTCHTSAGNGGGFGAPGLGDHSHPTSLADTGNVTRTAAAATPWANEIDDNSVAGADYPNNTSAALACESCHAVHKAGSSTPLLRLPNDGTLCANCHSDKN